MAANSSSLKKSIGKQAYPNTIQLKKGLTLPVEAKTIEGERFVYVSIPATSEVFKIDGKKLVPLDDKDLAAAEKELKAITANAPKGGRGPDPKIVEAEKKMREIVAGLDGYKVVTGADGFPRLAKMRAKKKTA